DDPGAMNKPMVNGDRTIPPADASSDLPNGIALNGNHLPVPTKPVVPESLKEMPPPPDLPHITFGYQSLGKLIARAAQHCFNELSDTITSMADMPVPVGASMTNGAGSHGSVSLESASASA